MKVVVTGVAGFLGSHVADRFVENGHTVEGIDCLVGGHLDNVPTGVRFHEADCQDLGSMRPILVGADIVLHAACTAYEGLSVFSPALVVANTTQATVSMLSASIASGVGKFIYCSSMARYGTQEVVPFTEDMVPRPQDPYGIAKVSAELLVKNISEAHGMKYTIVVPHNIIGPRQKFDDPFRNVASIMINRMLRGLQPIIYGDGTQTRCFSFHRDVVDPIYAACSGTTVDGMVVNIGPDEDSVTINELAALIARILNFDLDPIYMPGRPQEVAHANCSADRARKLLGYRTSTTLVDGLAELAMWIEKQGPRDFNYHLPLEFITEKTPRAWTERLL